MFDQMLEWALQKETACSKAVRNGPHFRMGLVVASLAFLIVTYFVPQITTETSSVASARAACRERYLHVLVGLENAADDLEEAGEIFDSFASFDLQPQHFLNFGASLVSLLGFICWLYSDHEHTSHAAFLDQKR